MAPWWVGGLLDELVFVRLMMNIFPPPVDDLGAQSSSSVDDPAMNKDKDKDVSNSSPRHQGEENSGGNKESLRVLYCTNMDFSMNFEAIHMLTKQYGKIERIRIKLSENENSIDSYIVFEDSESAANAHRYLNGHSVNNFNLGTRLFDVCNLKDDQFDYFPEDHSIPVVERKAPVPVWYVATYKDGRENYIKATETLHRALNGIPSNNMKKYGKNILIKVKNPIQGKLCQGYRPPEHSNISSISPHGFFNSVKGVIYSKDLHEFSEEEILHRSPPNVYQVKKLWGTNGAILITFSTQHLPDFIHFGDHIRIKVRRFKPNPKQCKNCFEYGHISNNCMNDEKCFVCSKTHDDAPCSSQMFCFHCDGKHSPTSNECPRKRFEREVIETANVEYISIGNAKRKVMGANRNENSSYAAAIKKMKTMTRKPNVKRVIASKMNTPPQSKTKGESSVKLNAEPQQSLSYTKDIYVNLTPKPQRIKSVSPKRQAPPKRPVPSKSEINQALEGAQAISPSRSGKRIEIEVEVHRSEGMETEVVRGLSKRNRTPSSSPPISPLHRDHHKKGKGGSLDDLSSLRSSEKLKRDTKNNPKLKNQTNKPNLFRPEYSGSGIRNTQKPT